MSKSYKMKTIKGILKEFKYEPFFALSSEPKVTLNVEKSFLFFKYLKTYKVAAFKEDLSKYVGKGIRFSYNSQK